MIYLVTNQKSMFENTTEHAFATVQDVFNYFEEKDSFEFDTETGGFDPYTVELISAQFGDAVNQYVVDTRTVDIKKFAPLFKGREVLMQNAKFDLKFLYRYGIVPDKVYDTMLAERVLTTGDKRARKGLDYLVWKYCKFELDKTVRGAIHREGLSTRVIKYAAEDVKFLGDIKRKQIVKIDESKLFRALSLDNEYVRVLAYIEYSGFKLDAIKWQSKMQEDLKDLDESIKQLDEWVLSNGPRNFIKVDGQLDMFDTAANDPRCSILWSSSKQVIPLFKDLGIDVKVKDPKTGKFKESVEAKVIRPQMDKSPIIGMYLKYKAREKVVTTYGQTFLNQINPVTGKIHTQFTQIMDTGRLSCGGKNRATKEEYINLQNIPSDDRTRSCFVADSGNVLIVADYSGQEQIVLANQSLDKDILSFYDEDKGDMHSFVASKIFPELKGVDLKDVKSNYSNLRQIAKSAGFAINYGGTGATIAQNLSLPEEQGHEVYKAYFDAFPGLDNHFKKVKAQAMRDGFVFFNTITGRRSYIDFFQDFKELEKKIKVPGFWEQWRAEKQAQSTYFKEELKPIVRNYFKYKGTIERKALNYPIQGTSADITKLAGVYMFRYLEKNDLLFKVWMPNVVHDEILLECPEELAEELAQVLKDSMEKAGKLFYSRVALKADPVITSYWTH